MATGVRGERGKRMQRQRGEKSGGTSRISSMRRVWTGYATFGALGMYKKLPVQAACLVGC